MASGDRVGNSSNRNNTKKYPFFLDAKKNSTIPTWFIECSRDDAASMMVKWGQRGSVLMRPSSDGQFALTVRTTGTNSGTIKINHYSIRKNERKRFYVDIDIQHQPSTTLSEIFERFVQLAGHRKYHAFDCTMIEDAIPPESPSTPAAQAGSYLDMSKLSAPVLPPSRSTPSSNYIDMRRSGARSVVESASNSTDYLNPTNGYINPVNSPAVNDQYLTVFEDDEVETDSDGYLAMNGTQPPQTAPRRPSVGTVQPPTRQPTK